MSKENMIGQHVNFIEHPNTIEISISRYVRIQRKKNEPDWDFKKRAVQKAYESIDSMKDSFEYAAKKQDFEIIKEKK